MKRFVLLTLTFLCFKVAFCQKKNYYGIAYPVRLLYQGTPALNYGLFYGDCRYGEGGVTYRAIGVSLENSLDFNKPYLSAQIGWFSQFYFTELNMRGGVYLSKDRPVDVRIIPEIGFSPLGLIGVSVGYGISLTNYTNDYITPFRLGITYVIDEDKRRNI